MKSRLLILLSLMSVSAWAQQDTSANKQAAHAVYERHSVTATASLGFVDGYKQNYSLPADFVKNNTSGYH